MSVWAILRVKDEVDVIEATVRRILTEVDHVLVSDNGSTDATPEILKRLDVELIHDPEVAYYQSAAMTELATLARERGADWVVPVDADEVWLPRDGERIADLLADLPAEVRIAEAVIFDHVATDCKGLSPWRRREALPLRKVACRSLPDLTINQGNHSASYDAPRPLTVTGLLEVRHFPIRSVNQMISKARNGAAAYAATDLPADMGSHWRDWGRLTDEQLGEVFREFYFSADPESDPELILDPCP